MKSHNRIVGLAQAALLVLALIGIPADMASAHDDDVGSVTHLMMATFDKPEAPLAVGPVVVEGEYAIAGWTQEDRGGRALLKRKDGDWAIHLCAGDALKDETALRHMGIPPDVAAALAAGLAVEEANADPARVALFATFEGVMEMNADGSHPHGGDHDPHSAHGGG
jgi:periplasmic copper chaperone A